MAVLTESATLSDIILKDKTSNLYMLLEPNGTQNAAVLLSSDRMRAIIKWARREFDFVIVDLPPMAAAADSESITELADASLLVVRQNLATAPALNKAIESLKNGNAKLLGCVLNNVYSSPLPFNQDSNFGYANYDTYGHYDTYRSK